MRQAGLVQDELTGLQAGETREREPARPPVLAQPSGLLLPHLCSLSPACQGSQALCASLQKKNDLDPLSSGLGCWPTLG